MSARHHDQSHFREPVSISACSRRVFFGTVITSGVGPGTRAEVPAPLVHQVGIEGDHFSLDGKPLQIISGELHSARIPREYWRDRLQKARAMGLNTVSTYVFWNLHEPKPGVYDFRGNLDAAAFIRTAQEEGLYVILRPGTYVCGGVGPRRPAVLAVRRSEHGSAEWRRNLSWADETMVAATRQGSRSPTEHAWGTHYCRAGRERIGVVWERQGLHEEHSCRAQFVLREVGDTFLNTRGWGKGAAWINGHALGRFWNLGPQQTLYVPAWWLRKGTNDVVVFTEDRPKSRRIRGLRAPVFG